MNKPLPENFYWGAATSAFQVEGGPVNSDWESAAQEGKVPTIGRAADHYHRYEEDFDIAKELGHNAHRFSIEWARIEPREGEFDEAEIEHYRNVLRALCERGIEPFVTLWHFTLPQWFADKGGFEHPDAPDIFARYACKVVDSFDGLCSHYMTINEANIYSSLGWLRGAWPPFKRFSLAGVSHTVSTQHRESESRSTRSLFTPVTWYKVVQNLIQTHKRAYKSIKEKHADVQVGIVHQVHVYRSNWNPLNQITAWVAHYILNGIYKPVFNYCDEIGLNYYHYKKFGDTTEYPQTDMGWEACPYEIYYAAKYLQRFNKPLVVTEAGLADADELLRAWYITEQVRGLQKAYSEGIDIQGHLYWSLLDNYELDLGYEKRFGLVEIDYDTLERKIRPSAWVYKDIIERNGVVE